MKSKPQYATRPVKCHVPARARDGLVQRRTFVAKETMWFEMKCETLSALSVADGERALKPTTYGFCANTEQYKNNIHWCMRPTNAQRDSARDAPSASSSGVSPSGKGAYRQEAAGIALWPPWKASVLAHTRFSGHEEPGALRSSSPGHIFPPFFFFSSFFAHFLPFLTGRKSHMVLIYSDWVLVFQA